MVLALCSVWLVCSRALVWSTGTCVCDVQSHLCACDPGPATGLYQGPATVFTNLPHSAHHTSQCSPHIKFFFTLYLEPVSGAQIRASRYGQIHIRASCPIYGARNKQVPYLVRKRGPLICSEG